MKKYRLLPLLLFIIYINCSDDPFGRPDNITNRPRRYQTNPNNSQQNNQTNPNNSQPFNQSVPPQDNRTTNTSSRAHIVAIITSSEIAAIEEMKKYKNYGYPANIYQTTNGQYAVSIASFSDRQTAEQTMQNEIRKGKIPQTSFVTEMESSGGPRYDPSVPTVPPNQGVPDGYSNNQPRNYNVQPDEPPVYQPPRTGTYSGDQFHIVLAQSNSVSDAIQTANRYIQQGLTVFVYERTNGFAITYGKVFSRDEAATRQDQMRQNNNLQGAIVTARDRSWGGIVYP